MINPTVARLTSSSLLGRRRKFLLLAVPVILLGLAALGRALAGVDQELTEVLLGVFAMGTLMPLIALIAGTGAIGPEIDDRSIMYLLAKPVRRGSIVVSKLLVAVAVTVAFGALPILVAGRITGGEFEGAALAYFVAALAASVAYCSIFLWLGVVSRNSVVLGLLYAVVWETLIGQLIPGAQSLSVQQWSLAFSEQVAPDAAFDAGIDPAVGGIGVVYLVVVIVATTWQATRKLRTIRLGGDN